MKDLQEKIEELWDAAPEDTGAKVYDHLFQVFKDGLNTGAVRAAEPCGGDWRVNEWVKKGILLGFRYGRLQHMSPKGDLVFYDKHTYPLKNIQIEDGIRIVPGGSSIRDGCYVASRVTCMPPMYINTGAYVDEGTMIDSHALVGSCAQVGKRVHISAAAQIGGVLEPIGLLPVIIEDDVLVGGNCGIYEGTIVRRGAVLGAGAVITSSTPVFDLVKDTVYTASGTRPLEIPAGAVVVPGTRPVARGIGRQRGISLATPVIVKYRDEKTSAGVELEELLR